MNEPEKRMTIRIPADVRAELEREAAEQERTLNGQIVYALRQYLASRREG